MYCNVKSLHFQILQGKLYAYFLYTFTTMETHNKTKSAVSAAERGNNQPKALAKMIEKENKSHCEKENN